MSPRVFVSYRREDSRGETGRIADRLALEFGKENLFLDVDDIPLGANFVKHLSAEVQRCDVLLAVIGKQWLELRDDHGHRKIDSPTDAVRIELVAALKRDVPIIPILLDGTKIPRSDLLPEDINELSFRNGLDLRYSSFHSDMNRLVRDLRAMLPPSPDADSTQQLSEPEQSPAQGPVLPPPPEADSTQQLSESARSPTREPDPQGISDLSIVAELVVATVLWAVASLVAWAIFISILEGTREGWTRGFLILVLLLVALILRGWLREQTMPVKAPIVAAFSAGINAVLLRTASEYNPALDADWAWMMAMIAHMSISYLVLRYLVRPTEDPRTQGGAGTDLLA